jgi:hypothetical protein
MAAALLCLGVVKGVTSRKTIWDDAAFKRWVEDGAKRQGMTLREVLHAAGVSRFYLKTPREKRSTNIVMKFEAIAAVARVPRLIVLLRPRCPGVAVGPWGYQTRTKLFT